MPPAINRRQVNFHALEMVHLHHTHASRMGSTVLPRQAMRLSLPITAAYEGLGQSHTLKTGFTIRFLHRVAQVRYRPVMGQDQLSPSHALVGGA